MIASWIKRSVFGFFLVLVRHDRGSGTGQFLRWWARKLWYSSRSVTTSIIDAISVVAMLYDWNRLRLRAVETEACSSCCPMSLGLLLNRGSDHFSTSRFAHDAVPQFVGDVLAIIDNWGLYQPMLRIQYRSTSIPDRELDKCNDQCEDCYWRFVLRESPKSRKNGLRWQANISELFNLILKLLCGSLHPLLLLFVFFIHLLSFPLI